MIDFIKKHCYWNFNFLTILLILLALFVMPFSSKMPEKFGYENGLIENIQMVVLFIGFYFSWTTKEYKKLFIFVGLVISILLLREVNFGRTIFFAVEGKENTFYKWKDLKYGYLARPMFGCYIAMVLFYFIKNKLYFDAFQIIKKFCFPILSILCFISAVTLGIYAERKMHNLVMEELAELFVYIFFVQMLWMYSRQKVKKIS